MCEKRECSKITVKHCTDKLIRPLHKPGSPACQSEGSATEISIEWPSSVYVEYFSLLKSVASCAGDKLLSTFSNTYNCSVQSNRFYIFKHRKQ